MFAFYNDAVGVAYQLVTALTSVVGSAAVAIVVFTIAVRLALHPLARRAARAGRDRQRLAPRVAELRKRHADDPAALYRETTALYQAEGTSAFAGFGATLLQLPVFSVVYRLFLSPVIGGHLNLLLAQTLFGTRLGTRWLGVALSPHGLVFLGLFAAVALVAWWSSRRIPEAPAGALGRVLRLLPYGTVLVAAYVPLAAGLYLLTTTVWSAAERALLSRGPATVIG
jgi:YidC/Oxa1 family membrane protein insertase